MTEHQKRQLPSWRYCVKCKRSVRSCPHDEERHTVSKQGKWWWVLKDNHELICEVYRRDKAYEIMEFLNS